MVKRLHVEQQHLQEIIGKAYSEWAAIQDEDRPEDARANPDTLSTDQDFFQGKVTDDILAIRAVVRRSNRFLTAMQNKIFWEKVNGKSFRQLATALNLDYRTVYDHYEAARKKFIVEFQKEKENI